jgi:hypothetical protein
MKHYILGALLFVLAFLVMGVCVMNLVPDAPKNSPRAATGASGTSKTSATSGTSGTSRNSANSGVSDGMHGVRTTSDTNSAVLPTAQKPIAPAMPRPPGPSVAIPIQGPPAISVPPHVGE